MTAVSLDLFADLLAVGNLCGIELDLNAELGLKLGADNVKLSIAHAGDDHLLGLSVVNNGEGPVLFAEPCEALSDLILLTLGLGSDSHSVARSREVDSGRGLYSLGIAESVAGSGVGEL